MAVKVHAARKTADSSPDVFMDGGVLQLVSNLSGLLSSVNEETAIPAIRNCVTATYGAANVTEVGLFTNYKWEWVENPPGWIRICCDNSLLEINDGQANPLTIFVEVGTPYTT